MVAALRVETDLDRRDSSENGALSFRLSINTEEIRKNLGLYNR
jgi:hypothetical protein